MILKHFDKENLHHAYLIESEREEAISQILKFLEEIGVEISKNPDFYKVSVDTFKVEDARNLKSLSGEKGASADKKIFIISANSFLLEAQNTLLKMFEEPIANTHFFIIVPDTDTLLPTLVSRFYLIKNQKKEIASSEVEKFLKMSMRDRLDFVKEFLVEEEEEDGVVVLNSTRSKALAFINSLETSLHQISVTNTSLLKDSRASFQQIFKVREFLRQPGSSVKSLVESVCLSIPKF